MVDVVELFDVVVVCHLELLILPKVKGELQDADILRVECRILAGLDIQVVDGMNNTGHIASQNVSLTAVTHN